MKRKTVNRALWQTIPFQTVKNMNTILKIRKETMILILVMEVAVTYLRDIVMLFTGTGVLEMKYTL